MNNKRFFLTPAWTLAILALGAANQANAVELLVSGNFETPGGQVGDVPGWTLEEFLTGSAAAVDSATISGGTDPQLFLQAYNGGGPLHPAQGNFDDDSLPAGDTDGNDFLIWQRGVGKPNALPSEGDATTPPDGIVNSTDLGVWKNNFGKKPQMANARLSQVVPAAAGTTYSFQGTSLFEDHYSGFVTNLEAASPFGQIPSPTVTQFKMEFLDAGGLPIGSPVVRDLRTEQTFPGFPVQHAPLTALAPAGTQNVRVTAQALNMVWNGTVPEGPLQSAFFNDFSLTTSAAPTTDLLTNGNLNAGTPDALDFWNQVETPATRTEILRTPAEIWANHTPGGSRGVFLSAFFGKHASFEPTPVDGIISQTVTAVAGGTYTFSGWTKFEANYAGGVDTISLSTPGTSVPGSASPTHTEIKLEFLDINSVVIGSSVIDAKAARRLISPTGNANDNQWYQHTLQAIAPANTRFARLTAQMIQGVFNVDPGQSAFFDDFSLNGPAASLATNFAVPEPTSLVSLAVGALLVGLKRNRKK